MNDESYRELTDAVERFQSAVSSQAHDQSSWSEIDELRDAKADLLALIGRAEAAQSTPAQVHSLQAVGESIRYEFGCSNCHSRATAAEAGLLCIRCGIGFVSRIAASPQPDRTESVAAQAVDREFLGRHVRMVWVEWAREQPNPKASWLAPWESLTESEREVDRRIGERIAALMIIPYDQPEAHQGVAAQAVDRDPYVAVVAALAAAISLLERGGRKAAASDTMFATMLDDYRRALENGRAAILSDREAHQGAEPVGWVNVLDRLPNQTAHVLGFFPGPWKAHWGVTACFYFDETHKPTWMYEDGVAAPAPTHWHPLPPPPGDNERQHAPDDAREALERAAKLCEAMRPKNGYVRDEARALAFRVLTVAARNIRALIPTPSAAVAEPRPDGAFGRGRDLEDL